MAITFDAGTYGQFTTGTSLTFSHTTGAGTDRILFCMGQGATGSSNSVTGITYGGVSMTSITGIQVPGDRYISIWYLVNPASGANDVVVSNSGSTSLRWSAVSYAGASQTGQPDGSDTSSATANAISTDITTTADNCWAVMFVKDDNGGLTYTSSTGDTIRYTADGAGHTVLDTGAAITPAGSNTMTISHGGGAANIAAVSASFSPPGAVATFIPKVIMF